MYDIMILESRIKENRLIISSEISLQFKENENKYK